MSNISRCAIIHETPWVLSPIALIQVVGVAAVLLTLGVAHLSLRFHLTRIQRETSQLQMRESDLSSEVKALQGKTESLKNPKRLFEYARLELGMVPSRPDEEKRVLRVPDDVYSRYLLARAELDGRTGPVRTGESAWYEKVGNRLDFISKAVAGDLSDKPEAPAAKKPAAKKAVKPAAKSGKAAKAGKTKKS